MPINDFANDGAFGSSGASDGPGAIPTGGYQANDGGMNGDAGGSDPSWLNNYIGGTQLIQNDQGRVKQGVAHTSGGGTPAGPMSDGSDPSWLNAYAGGTQLIQNDRGRVQQGVARYFSDGGAVDGGDDEDSSNDVGSLLALALSSVDAGLDFGRKKYGLSQDKGQQQAAMGRTPAIPGNQSESGMPRPQPMPGPLPPTSNPFGQRRQFGQNDHDQDDQPTQTAQAGAIPDNDEDDQEGTA